MLNFIKEMKTESSTNGKKKILKKYDSDLIRTILSMTYDTIVYTYSIQPESLSITPGTATITKDELTGYVRLLVYLDKVRSASNKNREILEDFINQYDEESQSLLLGVLKRNLDIGVNTSTINKVLGVIITNFKVTLANKYKFEKLPSDDLLLSRKLDGVRCLAIKLHGVVGLWSRQGKEFTTLGKLKKELEKYMPDNTVFDGEVCVIKDGKEDFKSVMKEVRKKDHTIDNPRYFVFDYINYVDFINHYSDCDYTTRYELLQQLNLNTSNYITLLDQASFPNNPLLIRSMLEKVIKDGWEGLMIRVASSPYEGKRTNNLLKVKAMREAEYTICGYAEGTGKYKEMLGSIRVALDVDNTVDIGSGFSDEDRQELWNKRHTLEGRVVSVQYFEESSNKKGEKSLRFPVFRGFRDDGYS